MEPWEPKFTYEQEFLLRQIESDDDEEDEDDLDDLDDLDLDELESMDEDERREALEEAGYDPDDFDYDF